MSSTINNQLLLHGIVGILMLFQASNDRVKLKRQLFINCICFFHELFFSPSIHDQTLLHSQRVVLLLKTRNMPFSYVDKVINFVFALLRYLVLSTSPGIF